MKRLINQSEFTLLERISTLDCISYANNAQFLTLIFYFKCKIFFRYIENGLIIN